MVMDLVSLVQKQYIVCENNIFDECFVCDPCGDGSDGCIEWDQLCNEPVAFDGAYQISEDEFITILLEADDPNDDLLSYQIEPTKYFLTKKRKRRKKQHQVEKGWT